MSVNCQSLFLTSDKSLHIFAVKSKRMKRFLFWCMLFTSLTALAQKEVVLKEVTVKGAKVVQRVDGQTIYPTRQQLEGSVNGYSLLSKLTLPHLRVDPVMHTITALSNLGEVQVRINDIDASKEDLLSLDMKAVQHIDYIDNPGVRYGEGVAYVINILVKHHMSGCDIGADLTNTLTAVNGDETVYGKYNCGRNEVGVTCSLDYRNLKGMEYEEYATYELESGETQNALRRQLAGQNKSLGHHLQLTYNLSDSDYVFQSKLSARNDIQPNRTWATFETYDDYSSSSTFSPVLDLYLHRQLKRHQSLTANVVGTYIKTSSHEEHNEGGNYSFEVTGKAYSLWTEAVYENRLKPFTWSIGAQYGQKFIDNVYSSDVSAENDMRSSVLYFFGQ